MRKERRIGFEIRAVHNLIKRDVEITHPKEIDCTTATHGFAIKFLYNNLDKDVFQKDFENHFSIRRSTATRMLQLMEKNGLIIRESVESDGRLKKIVLTQKAIDIHKKITKNIEDREKRLSLGLTKEELDSFFRIIDKIKANLEVHND